MRVQPRERMIRLFLGALLGSDLSERDLESAMSEICTDASFLLDLRLALTQSLRRLGDQRALSDSVNEGPVSLSIEDRIVDAIQRRRMSRATARDLMLAAVPDFRKVRVSNKMSLRAIIKEFLSTASANDARRLLQSIDSLGSEDPYLKGIVTRR